MTMTLDASQQQRFAPPLNFDYPHHHGQQPTFSNPWSSSTSPPQSAPTAGNPLFVGSQHQSGMNPNMMAGKGPVGRAGSSSTSSMASYGSLPVASTGAGMNNKHIHDFQSLTVVNTMNADLLSMNRMQTTSATYGDATYATSASPVNGHFAPGSAAPYDAIGYAPAPLRQSHFGIGPEADSARRGFPQP